MIEIQKVFDDGSVCERCDHFYKERESYNIGNGVFYETWRYCALIHDGEKGSCLGEQDE